MTAIASGCPSTQVEKASAITVRDRGIVACMITLESPIFYADILAIIELSGDGNIDLYQLSVIYQLP